MLAQESAHGTCLRQAENGRKVRYSHAGAWQVFLNKLHPDFCQDLFEIRTMLGEPALKRPWFKRHERRNFCCRRLSRGEERSYESHNFCWGILCVLSVEVLEKMLNELLDPRVRAPDWSIEIPPWRHERIHFLPELDVVTKDTPIRCAPRNAFVLEQHAMRLPTLVEHHSAEPNAHRQ